MPVKYPITDEQRVRNEKNYTYHAPKDDQPERYVEIRAAGSLFETIILERTSPSREQSLALTKIEEAIFWANAAITRNE